MSTTIDIDIIEGSSLEQDEHGNYRKTRIYRVSGLTGSTSAREYAAMQTAGIPQRGEYHPDIPGIYVVSRSAQADSPDLVEVTCVYGVPSGHTPLTPSDPPRLRIGSSLHDMKTIRDKDGKLITLSYTPDTATDWKTLKSQTQPVSIPKPMFFLEYSRAENEPPDHIAAEYVGKLNSTPFAGQDARSFLMASITGDSNDGGDTWQVTYTIQYNPDGWDKTIWIYDTDTGLTPPDISDGNGEATPKVIPEADFNKLGL